MSSARGAALDMPTSHQADALRSGAIDVSLTRAPAPSPNLETLLVDREGLMLAVPARHTLAGKRGVPWERLRKERLLSFPRSSHPRLHDAITGAAALPGSSRASSRSRSRP